MYIQLFSAIGHNLTVSGESAPFEPWDDYWCARIPAASILPTQQFEGADARYYSKLDLTGKMAVTLVKQLLDQGAQPERVSIGSARGATGIIEQLHGPFSIGQRIPVHTSPLTTAGNIAAAATHLNGLEVPSLTVSMTCSSALHALIGVLERMAGGRLSEAIAGGIEAPVTRFTRAQFEVLRLLARHNDEDGSPCKPFSGDPINRVVLAEGGALFALSTRQGPWRIAGWGEAAEHLPNPVSLAGKALRKAMRTALGTVDGQEVDLVIAHAPGTAQGDPEELAAIRECCGDHPRIVSGKWLTGHTLGASGAVALAQALFALESGFPELDYTPLDDGGYRGIPRRVMVNATGFGGNAAAIVVERSNG